MRVKQPVGWALAATGIIAAIVLGSCTDGLLVRPASSVPVRLALGLVPAASVMGTDPDACAKTNAARIRLLQSDAVVLDTTLAVSDACGSPILLRVPLRIQSGALQISVELLANAQPAFQGSASVQLARGETTNAQVTVTPIPAAIAAPDSLRTFTRLGDSVRVSAAVLFATGDTVSGAQPTWTVDGQGVVTLSNGVVRSVGEGTAQLTASFQAVTHITRVRVRAVVVSVSVTGVTSMFIGATNAFSAVARDSGGTTLQRTFTWASSDQAVATVDADGTVHAVGAGTTVISATTEGRSGSVSLTVAQVPVARVVVTPNPASVVVGGTVQMTATTYDAAGNVLTGRSVSWSSSSRIAPVGTTGLVTGVSGGTAVITATSEGASGTAGVSVEQLRASPTVVLDTVEYFGSGGPSVVNVQIFNAGTATLGGLRVAITYDGSPFVNSATLTSTTTPSTLRLVMTEQNWCGTYTGTATVSSTTPGIAPVSIPITHVIVGVCIASSPAPIQSVRPLGMSTNLPAVRPASGASF